MAQGNTDSTYLAKWHEVPERVIDGRIAVLANCGASEWKGTTPINVQVFS